MRLLPLLVALLLTASLLTSIAALFTRRQHPRRILQRALGGASILAIVGLVGVLPAALWWLPWLLTLVLAAGAVLACRLLLTPQPPVEPSRRRAADLAAPTTSNMVVEVGLYLALLVAALLAG